MNFCPSCGNKLENKTSIFCGQCGHKLSANNESNKNQLNQPSKRPVRPEPKIESPKNRRPGLILLGVIVLIISAAIGYAIYEDSIYPKSENEIASLLYNKYWKINDMSIEEFYIDGKKITKPSSDIRHTIKNAVVGNTDDVFYNAFEESIEEMTQKDNFIFVKKLSSGELFHFGMNFDRTANDYTYTVSHPQLQMQTEHSRFAFIFSEKNPSSALMSTGNLVDDEDDVEIKKYEDQIAKITPNSLDIKSDLTMLMDGKEYRFVSKINYKLYSPPQNYIDRVEKESFE